MRDVPCAFACFHSLIHPSLEQTTPWQHADLTGSKEQDPLLSHWTIRHPRIAQTSTDMLPARPVAGTDRPTQHQARPIATRRHEPWDFQLELACVDSGTSSIISRPHVAKNRHSDAPEVTVRRHRVRIRLVIA